MKLIGDDNLANQLESVSQQEKLVKITDRLQGLFIGIMEPLIPVIDGIMVLIEDVIKPTMKILVPFVSTVVSSILTIFEPIGELFTDVKVIFGDIFGESKALGDIWGTIGKTLGTLVSLVFIPMKAIINGITQAMKPVVDLFDGIVDLIHRDFEGGMKKIIKGLIGFIISPIQFILSMVDSTINTIIEGLNKIPGIKLEPIDLNITDSITSLVPLAKGGIVTKPTQALIGEAGPEAVIPLNKQINVNLDPLLERINVLIKLVENGGNVYLDGNKVGTAMSLSTFKTQ
jgi:phage-related protein